MIMHDHETRPEGGVYCPIMREICVEGWTRSMGGKWSGQRPRCVRWRPVTVMIGGPKGTPREVWDCADGWIPDLLVQAANESYSAAAATESARNHIAGQAHDFRSISNVMTAVARKHGISRENILEVEKDRQEFERKMLEQKVKKE